ncbi:MAG: hypothetical protein EXQ94_13240 [Alphaproteobacteria bacterium]|nr:hypothetical protein [Alphaproteobacteria bacterium]
MARRPVLRGLTDIYAFFRTNPTPIYFLSPTPYNILGLDRWINRFEYINFFDFFDGRHPKVLTPREHGLGQGDRRPVPLRRPPHRRPTSRHPHRRPPEEDVLSRAPGSGSV